MKRRSKTNSRRHENLALREYYRQKNVWNELKDRIPGIYGTSFAEEIHHIAKGSGGTSRWDVVTNLISLSRESHAWCERYKWDGMILCLAVKLNKSEYDPVVFRETVLGLTRPGASVAGYLMRKPCEFPWVEPIKKKVCEQIERMEQL